MSADRDRRAGRGARPRGAVGAGLPRLALPRLAPARRAARGARPGALAGQQRPDRVLRSLGLPALPRLRARGGDGGARRPRSGSTRCAAARGSCPPTGCAASAAWCSTSRSGRPRSCPPRASCPSSRSSPRTTRSTRSCSSTPCSGRWGSRSPSTPRCRCSRSPERRLGRVHVGAHAGFLVALIGVTVLWHWLAYAAPLGRDPEEGAAVLARALRARDADRAVARAPPGARACAHRRADHRRAHARAAGRSSRSRASGASRS